VSWIDAELCPDYFNFAGATWVWSYSSLTTRGMNLCWSPCGITQMQYCAALWRYTWNLFQLHSTCIYFANLVCP